MDIQNQGIILNVFNFDKCVSFYKTVFNLPEMFTKTDGDFRLTCLEFGSSYLYHFCLMGFVVKIS